MIGRHRSEHETASPTPVNLEPKKERLGQSLRVKYPVELMPSGYAILHAPVRIAVPQIELPRLLTPQPNDLEAYSRWELVRLGRAGGSRTGFEGYFAYADGDVTTEMLRVLSDMIATHLDPVKSRTLDGRQKVLSRNAKRLQSITETLCRGCALKAEDDAMCRLLFPILLGRLRSIPHGSVIGRRLEKRELEKVEKFRGDTTRFVREGRLASLEPEYLHGDEANALESLSLLWQVSPETGVPVLPGTGGTAPSELEHVLFSFLRELGRYGSPIVRRAQAGTHGLR